MKLAPGFLKSLKELLEKELSCPACSKALQAPVTLHCGHSYCTPCLDQIFELESQRPECRICGIHFSCRTVNRSRALSEIARVYAPLVSGEESRPIHQSESPRSEVPRFLSPRFSAPKQCPKDFPDLSVESRGVPAGNRNPVDKKRILTCSRIEQLTRAGAIVEYITLKKSRVVKKAGTNSFQRWQVYAESAKGRQRSLSDYFRVCQEKGWERYAKPDLLWDVEKGLATIRKRPKSYRDSPVHASEKKDEDPGEVCQVEKLLALRRRTRGGDEVTEYRVRWLGYQEDDDTWVRSSLISKDCIDVFHGNGPCERGQPHNEWKMVTARDPCDEHREDGLNVESCASFWNRAACIPRSHDQELGTPSSSPLYDKECTISSSSSVDESEKFPGLSDKCQNKNRCTFQPCDDHSRSFFLSAHEDDSTLPSIQEEHLRLVASAHYICSKLPRSRDQRSTSFRPREEECRISSMPAQESYRPSVLCTSQKKSSSSEPKTKTSVSPVFPTNDAERVLRACATATTFWFWQRNTKKDAQARIRLKKMQSQALRKNSADKRTCDGAPYEALNKKAEISNSKKRRLASCGVA